MTNLSRITVYKLWGYWLSWGQLKISTKSGTRTHTLLFDFGSSALSCWGCYIRCKNKESACFLKVTEKRNKVERKKNSVAFYKQAYWEDVWHIPMYPSAHGTLRGWGKTADNYWDNFSLPSSESEVYVCDPALKQLGKGQMMMSCLYWQHLS